jgi:hypothetical protein
MFANVTEQFAVRPTLEWEIELVGTWVTCSTYDLSVVALVDRFAGFDMK